MASSLQYADRCTTLPSQHSDLQARVPADFASMPTKRAASDRSATNLVGSDAGFVSENMCRSPGDRQQSLDFVAELRLSNGDWPRSKKIGSSHCKPVSGDLLQSAFR